MELWTTEDKAIISANSVTSKTYSSKVASVGFANYVKSLGGIFEKCYGHNEKITTVEELHERMRFVAGLMAIFRFCYWNGSTWWYWLNSSSKAYYSSKQTKSCRGGSIYQLCQGTDGRTRITCCNYGVDTLLRAIGQYGMKRTNITSKSKLQPGDVIDFMKASNGKWHHQVMVHSIVGDKIWCLDFGSRFIKTGKPLHYMSMKGSSAGGEYGSDKWIGRHRVTLKYTTSSTIPSQTINKEEDIPVPRTVKKGSTGKAVRVVQSILGITIDGKFGSKTDAAVKKFQSSKKLTVDGVVGPKTWRALLTSIQ